MSLRVRFKGRLSCATMSVRAGMSHLSKPYDISTHPKEKCYASICFIVRVISWSVVVCFVCFVLVVMCCPMAIICCCVHAGLIICLFIRGSGTRRFAVRVVVGLCRVHSCISCSHVIRHNVFTCVGVSWRSCSRGLPDALEADLEQLGNTLKMLEKVC